MLQAKFEQTYSACGIVPIGCPVYVQNYGTWHQRSWTESASLVCYSLYAAVERFQRSTDEPLHSRVRLLQHTYISHHDRKLTHDTFVTAECDSSYAKIRHILSFLPRSLRSRYSAAFRITSMLIFRQVTTNYSLDFRLEIDHYYQRKMSRQQSTTAHSWVVQLGQATTPKSRPGQVMATHEGELRAVIGWY